jgi:hypothetical protein
LMSDKDKRTFSKIKHDTDDLMAKRRRVEMTKGKKDRQKGLEEY